MTLWKHCRLLPCWYMFQIDKITNHVVYKEEKLCKNLNFYKIAKSWNFLKKFSGRILAVRTAKYSIKPAQDIGPQLILWCHHASPKKFSGRRFHYTWWKYSINRGPMSCAFLILYFAVLTASIRSLNFSKNFHL